MTESMRTAPRGGEHIVTKLRGNLGLISIAFMVVAGAAPLTVVGGPVPLAFAFGNGAGVPAMFVVTGIILAIFAVGFTTMSRHVPSAGALYAYAYVGIGRRTGMGTGYAALLSYMCLYVGVYGLLGPALGDLVVSFHGPDLPWWLWSCAALLAVSLIGHRNVEFSGRILGLLLVAEIVITVALNAVVISTNAHGKGLSTAWADPAVFTSGAPGVAFLFAVLGFIGFEATVVFRDEARNPDKTVPRATYLAVAFIGVFYALTSWAMVSAIGDADVAAVSAAAPADVLPMLAGQYLGSIGTSLIRVLFVTSIFACILTFHNVVARYMFSLANRSLLPKLLARVHPRYKSPHTAGVATAMTALVSVALALALKLSPIEEFYTWLVGLASLGYVLLLLVASVSVIAFFARRPDLRLGSWRTRIAPLLGLVGLLVTLLVILANLSLLVGGHTGVAIGIVILLIAAFALGPAVAAVRPRSGREAELSPTSKTPHQDVNDPTEKEGH
ncbi:APC family permease [Mycolicibacterium goodii]|uniref:APC family permease n=1 Tax=Mycolicibacterium goodii TaxID=134601 RepID=UPI001BDCD748|nr:APC family permease [Mycolicibacterium goodii]MBU8820818.1 APC family permease [Mycolicibacterium goodii]